MTIQPAASALSRVTELFELASDDEGDKRTQILSKLNGEIEFKNVSFSYDQKKDVLTDVCFKINPGEKAAFTGSNGSGKSTIIKLILGLYKTERGKITIDGHDINSINLSSLRNKISVVSQNVFLFNDTIRNNILYSNPSAGEEQIIEAAQKAGAYEFIMAQEKGLDTNIGEIGKKLSGGEKQKISIARAIIKDSDVIIFDEATSNLDKKSIKKIQTIIDQDFAGKTCIIVTHHLANSSKMDKIYMLDSGKAELL